MTNVSQKSHFDTLNCTLEEFAVLQTIEDNHEITQTEIAKSIKKSTPTVKHITAVIVEKGIIIFVMIGGGSLVFTNFAQNNNE